MLNRQNTFSLTAWIVVLATLPLFILLKLQPLARDLYRWKEPHCDFFFFHDAKAIYLNLAVLLAAAALFLLTRETAPQAWAFPQREKLTRRLPIFFFVAARRSPPAMPFLPDSAAGSPRLRTTLFLTPCLRFRG